MFKNPLVRKLAITVVLKLLVLFALWFFLIRPKFIHVSSADLTARVYGAPSATINQSR